MGDKTGMSHVKIFMLVIRKLHEKWEIQYLNVIYARLLWGSSSPCLKYDSGPPSYKKSYDLIPVQNLFILKIAKYRGKY